MTLRPEPAEPDKSASLAAGDAASWEAFVRRMTPRVFGLLVRQCRDRDLAEELTQTTFVKVYEKFSHYHERGKLEPWVFRIAMNALKDETRRRKRQAAPTDLRLTEPMDAGDTDPGSSLQRAEQVAQLREAFELLSEADRRVLTLRYTGELTYAQIADTLEEPLGTVLARGHRAIKKLADLLGAGRGGKEPR